MTASTTGTVPSFADVPLRGDHSATAPTQADVAQHISAAASANGYTPEQLDWPTPEGIAVKPLFGGADGRCYGPIQPGEELHR